MGTSQDLAYWDNRYKIGGDSGFGSKGDLLTYKAETINEIIKEFGAKSVVDLGCGDGNLARLIECEEYTGYDISQEAINIASKKRKGNFTTEVPEGEFDIALSIDIIGHITDKGDLRDHLNYLKKHKNFIIYAPKKIEDPQIHENSFNWVQMLKKKASRIIPQKYTVEEFGVFNGSYSEWYIY